MWNIKIMEFEFFFIAYSFFIFSVAGWLYESCKCSIEEKTFVNRGFLNGPIIPIYGIGGTLTYIMLLPFKQHACVVFILGFFLTTFLEYVTAVAMEKAFHAKWWDYSRFRLNFQGRICLPASLLWAVFSVADVYMLGPVVNEIVSKIPRRSGEQFGYALILVTLIDLTVTTVFTLQLSIHMSRLTKMREELLSYLLNTALIERTSEVKETLRSATISKLASKKELAMNMLTTRFKASLSKEIDEEDRERRVDVFKRELETKFKSFIVKYRMDTHKNNYVHKRLLKAFPTLTFTKGRYYLQELKERMNSRTGKKS